MTVTKGVIIRQRRTDEEKQGIESGARCKGHQDHALLLCSTFANRANTHDCDENRQEAIALLNSKKDKCQDTKLKWRPRAERGMA